jgi:hypothetical protein
MPSRRLVAQAQREPKKRELLGVAKPQARTIKQVVEYLNQIGLFVYGQAHDLETGDMFLGQRDYNAQSIITYRRKWHNNTLGTEPVELE